MTYTSSGNNSSTDISAVKSSLTAAVVGATGSSSSAAACLSGTAAASSGHRSTALDSSSDRRPAAPCHIGSPCQRILSSSAGIGLARTPGSNSAGRNTSGSWLLRGRPPVDGRHTCPFTRLHGALVGCTDIATRCW